MLCIDGKEESQQETRDRLDAVTAMLCSVLGALEAAEEPVRLEDLPPEIRSWWYEHKEADARRKHEERCRQSRDNVQFRWMRQVLDEKGVFR